MKDAAVSFFANVKPLIRLVFTLGLGLGLGSSIAPAQDAVRLLPYQGVVAGELLCLVDFQSFQIEAWGTSEAWTRSSRLGVGVQRYEGDEVTVTLTEDGFLVAEGRARTLAANGDELSTYFVIRAAFDANDPFGELCYEGTYWVLEDGTGRFDYPAGLACGALGIGYSADGIAALQPVPNLEGLPLYALSFANSFEGTLAQIEPRRGKRK